MNRGWIGVLMILLCASNALALGIAYEYMEGNTITVPQGNERVFRLTLQNEQNASVKVNVSVESDIAVMRNKTIFELGPKTYNTAADILISIPKNASIGSNYTIRYVVTPIDENITGQVPFNIKYDRGFIVKVGMPADQAPLLSEQEEQKEQNSPQQSNIESPQPQAQSQTASILTTIILILLIAAILGLVWRSSSKLSGKIGNKRKDNQNSSASNNNKTQEPINGAAATQAPVQSTIPQTQAMQMMQEATPADAYATATLSQQTQQQSTIAQNSSASSTQTIIESATHIPIQQNAAELPPNIPKEFFDAPKDAKDAAPSEYSKEQESHILPKAQAYSSRLESLKQEMNDAFSKQSGNEQNHNDNQKTLPKADEHSRFFVDNGPALEDLMQLKYALVSMTNDQYNHHVHDDINDFASWTQGVFGMQDLAQKMRGAHSRNDLLEVLENEL